MESKGIAPEASTIGKAQPQTLDPPKAAAIGQPTPAEVRRGLGVMLGVIYLMRMGFFMLTPLISVHFVQGYGWAAASIGIAFAVREFFHQGLTIVGGVLGDRYGAKPLIIAGLAVRVVAFAGLAVAQSFPAVLGFLALAGLAGALFDAPRAAVIAQLTTPATRNRFFSVMNAASNLGILSGPLVAIALLEGPGFGAVAIVSAGCYVVALLLVWAVLPNARGIGRPLPGAEGLRRVAADRRFLVLTGLLSGYWIMWAQLEITLPLAVADATGLQRTASVLLLVYAATTVILQYPLIRMAERRMSTGSILSLGLALMASGLAVAAAIPGSVGIFASAALLGVGSVLALPTQQTLVANLADPAALGAYFGVSSLALAVGGGLGAWLGGTLYGLAQATGFAALPWLVFGAVGSASAVGIRILAPSSQAVPGTSNGPA